MKNNENGEELKDENEPPIVEDGGWLGEDYCGEIPLINENPPLGNPNNLEPSPFYYYNYDAMPKKTTTTPVPETLKESDADPKESAKNRQAKQPAPSGKTFKSVSLKQGFNREKMRYEDLYLQQNKDFPKEMPFSVNCGKCGSKINDRNDVHYCGGRKPTMICAECVKTATSKCRFCDEYFFPGEGDEGFCPSCIHNAVNNYIQHYSTKAEQHRKKIVNRSNKGFTHSSSFTDDFAKEKNGQFYGEILYGVEVEYVAKPIEKLGVSVLKAKMAVDKFAVLKYDSTLDIEDSNSPNGKKRAGFEITSSPADLDAHRVIWDELFEGDALDKSMQPTEKCGMHVHRSKDDLTHLTLGKILKFVHDKSNYEFMKLIAGREPNLYCDFTYEKKVPDSKKPYSGKTKDDPNNNHRTAINFHTSTRRTIEFRIFRSTRSKAELLKNVEFVDALCDFCKSSSIQDDYEVFVRYVIGNRGRYKYLYRFFHGDEFGMFANRFNPGLLSLIVKKAEYIPTQTVSVDKPGNKGNKDRIIPDPSKKFGGSHLW